MHSYGERHVILFGDVTNWGGERNEETSGVWDEFKGKDIIICVCGGYYLIKKFRLIPSFSFYLRCECVQNCQLVCLQGEEDSKGLKILLQPSWKSQSFIPQQLSDSFVCFLGGGLSIQKYFCQTCFHLFAFWAGKQTTLVTFIASKKTSHPTDIMVVMSCIIFNFLDNKLYDHIYFCHYNFSKKNLFYLHYAVEGPSSTLAVSLDDI